MEGNKEKLNKLNVDTIVKKISICPRNNIKEFLLNPYIRLMFNPRATINCKYFLNTNLNRDCRCGNIRHQRSNISNSQYKYNAKKL